MPPLKEKKTAKGRLTVSVMMKIASAISEEQEVAIEVEGGSPPEGKSLICQSWTGKAPKPQTLESLLFLLCLYMFAAAIFLWYLA